jgi:multidrug resistance efflux pump
MSISNDEYTMLVEQLTAVKMEKYELIEKNKKMVLLCFVILPSDELCFDQFVALQVKDSTADKNRILELESQNAHYFKERQRADELLAASKDAQQVSELKHENENQREQIKLLKQSMQQLFEGQQKAQSELEYLRKVQSKGRVLSSISTA